MNVRRSIIAVIFAYLCMGVSFANQSQLSIKSSMLWQPHERQVYFPGIPAVLRQGTLSKERYFRLEVYFSGSTQGLELRPHLEGPWLRGGFWQTESAEFGGELVFTNGVVDYKSPECDQAPTTTINGKVIGYRCVWDFFVGSDVASGTVKAALSMVSDNVEAYHPNLGYQILVPEGEARLDIAPELIESLNPPGGGSRESASWGEIEKQVVQIQLGGNFSIGSGFLVRELAPLLKKFTGRRIEIQEDHESPGLFVVTAAHVVPYIDPNKSIYKSNLISLSKEGEVSYDLVVNGNYVGRAATLLAEDMASDIAILSIKQDPVVMSAILSALGVATVDDIQGLQFASRLALQGDNCQSQDKSCGDFHIFGYPVVGSGKLNRYIGRIQEGAFPTDDTSNFGYIPKLKLDSVVGEDSLVSLSGVSGGPIIDRYGFVVGMATERPVSENSLIGVDLTREQSEVVPEFNEGCRYEIDPFSRIFRLFNFLEDCNYGRFGSVRKDLLVNLRGQWRIQEVLGFVSSQSSSKSLIPTSGQALVNGHAIINGHGIINGHAIIRGIESGGGITIIEGSTVDIVNEKMFVGGFRLNPDSFRQFATVGVRVLEASGFGPSDCAGLGRLIRTLPVGASGAVEPVYSLRNFVLWLHSQEDHSKWIELIESDSSTFDCGG